MFSCRRITPASFTLVQLPMHPLPRMQPARAVFAPPVSPHHSVKTSQSFRYQRSPLKGSCAPLRRQHLGPPSAHSGNPAGSVLQRYAHVAQGSHCVSGEPGAHPAVPQRLGDVPLHDGPPLALQEISGLRCEYLHPALACSVWACHLSFGGCLGCRQHALSRPLVCGVSPFLVCGLSSLLVCGVIGCLQCAMQSVVQREPSCSPDVELGAATRLPSCCMPLAGGCPPGRDGGGALESNRQLVTQLAALQCVQLALVRLASHRPWAGSQVPACQSLSPQLAFSLCLDVSGSPQGQSCISNGSANSHGG